MTTKKGKTSLRNSKRGHVIAVYHDNKISYHYVESKKDEEMLIGEIIGKYTTSEYLQDEKRIQEYHNLQMNIKKPKE